MMNSRAVTLLFAFLAMIAPPVGAAAHRLVSVSTPDQLQNALASPIEGDVIELANGTYSVANLSGSYDFFFILDPGVHFTVRAATNGGAILDGENTNRIMEYQVNTPGTEGWVTFEGLVFQNGRTTSFDAAGVITRGGRTTFIDCVFQNNQALPGTTSGSAAGAMALTVESVSQILDCSFNDNVSDNHGGAMLVGQGSTVFIHHSEFSNNRNNPVGHRPNGLGGAIHVFNGLQGTMTSLVISNTRFDGNKGAFAGGAIMAKGNFASSTQSLASPTTVVIANSTFQDNIALGQSSITSPSPTEGGGIMVENNVSLFLFNSRFMNNSGGFGGALSSNRGEITIESSVFRNNSAFGRMESSSTGRGGAIISHSNDKCTDENNLRTGSLSVIDSFFEGNQAQAGGAIFAAGDQTRMFSTTQGCQMGTFYDNRLPVTLDHVAISNCSVDDIIGNHAAGGGIYGILVDLFLTDSMVLDSVASGTDPSDFASPSQGHGGGASIRPGSRLTMTGTTFAGNVADHEGGGLHLLGTEIAVFTDNTFIGNEVSPGGNRSSTSSEGAAIYVSPSTTRSLNASGAIINSIFTDNIGLPIFDSDATDNNGCGCFNLVTYDGNAFYNNTYGDSVYRNGLVPGTSSASDLNTLVVDHGGGTLVEKSLQEANTDEISPITVSALLATPEGLINSTAAGDSLGSTESYLSWSWNGGCAELDQTPLAHGSENRGALSTSIGTHQLDVWSGGSCTGATDGSVVQEVLQITTPTANFLAHPAAISGGGSSTLLWSLSGGLPVAGMISNDAIGAITTPSGAVVVAPPASTGYHLTLVTRQGGATADETVYVDESPPTATIFIFSDDFESGDTGVWSSTEG